ncbi:IS1096 element passenger TnpR family protein [Tessaracoccus antarcticus]|nr:hypothetical protein [Tessaracoccus antarcticus]
MEDESPAGVVAAFEAWCAASPHPGGPEPSDAAASLADLFTRSRRGGADLRDPDAHLLRWLTRDLARHDDVHRDDDSDESDGAQYLLAIRTLMGFLLFLRAHGLWRRSERAVLDCWDVFTWATREPLGVHTLGSLADDILVTGLLIEPAPSDVVDTARELPFVPLLRSTLDALASQSPLSRDDLAAITGLQDTPGAVDIWSDCLSMTNLARRDAATDSVMPSIEVRTSGGCPPVDSVLVRNVVQGLVSAALSWGFDTDTTERPMRTTHPRGSSVLIALVCACDDQMYLAGDRNDADDEETTRGLVRMFVDKMLGAGHVSSPSVADEVLAVLCALTTLGVLQERRLPLSGEIYLAAPDALRHSLLQRVADFTGCIGGPDDTSAWQPIALDYHHAKETVFDLHLHLETGVGEESRPEAATEPSTTWRGTLIAASSPIDVLHDAVQALFGWRGLRPHVFLDSVGTRRFTSPGLLHIFDAPGDERITDQTAVRIGSVLTQPGDEVVYEYGRLQDPWRVRIRLDAVVDSPVDITRTGGSGESPAEQSLLAETLSRRLPQGMEIPDELERAWAFFEQRGWWGSRDADHFLAPCSFESRPGVVFSSECTLDGWFAPDSPAHERLLPIAVTDGTGSIAALWLESPGMLRVVGLGSEGEARLLAESVPDFLRLMAIGYPEFTPGVVGGRPDVDSRAALADYRHWVEETLGLDVPAEWPPFTRDRFSDWVVAHIDL